MNEHFCTMNGHRRAELEFLRRENERTEDFVRRVQEAVASGDRVWFGKFVSPEGMYDVYLSVEPERK